MLVLTLMVCASACDAAWPSQWYLAAHCCESCSNKPEASSSHRKAALVWLYSCCAACAGDERGAILGDKIVNTIGQTLLTTVCERAHAQPPFFLESVVLEAIFRLPGKDTREENVEYLWTQVGCLRLLLGLRAPLYRSHQPAHAVNAQPMRCTGRVALQGCGLAVMVGLPPCWHQGTAVAAFRATKRRKAPALQAASVGDIMILVMHGVCPIKHRPSAVPAGVEQ